MNLPDLATAEELAQRVEQQRMDEVRQYLLDARQNYPEPYYMLEYNGVPFSVIGGIQALSGQKKNGKTFVLAQLMAAILCEDNARREKFLRGLRVPERTAEWLGHAPTVLYVDTEMEKLNSAKVLRRVHWLCGWEMDTPNPRFSVLWLRGVTDVKDDQGVVKERAFAKRYRLIRTAIDLLKPDAVFIDGIRDIIGDFNDNEESAQLVCDIMALAEQRNLCIWSTLHMNPRPGNDDDSKMRGHLGTELGNKVTDTLVSIKSKQSDGTVTFTVKQNDARGKDMEDWRFSITDAAGALGVPQIISNGALLSSEDQQQCADADALFKMFRWTHTGATYTDLERHLRIHGKLTSNRRISKIFEVAVQNGIIFKSSSGKYHYNGLNRQVPNDSPYDLPFSATDSDTAPY